MSFLLKFLFYERFKLLTTCLIIIFGSISCVTGDAEAQYEQNIIFYGYTSNGSQFITNFSDNDTLLELCDPSENYTIVVHGWTESVLALWVHPLVQNFNETRHGCVFVMDY